MINITYYLNSFGIGGTEKTAQLFANHLNKNYFKVNLITLHNDTARLKLLNIDVNAIIVPDHNAVLDAIQDFKTDILHVFRSGFPEFPYPDKNTIFVETNVFGHIDPSPFIDKTIYMSRWLMEHSLKKYNSYYNCPTKRFDYIYNPTDLPSTNEKFNLLCAKDTIIIGRNGRPDNGIYSDLSVRAARNLLIRGYKIHYLVMSPPSNMIKDLEDYNIPFTVIDTSIDDNILSKFYNTIDIYCETRADGHTCGNVIQEAMIHKKPVITNFVNPRSDMGVFQAQTEIVDHRFTGFVTQENVNDFAEAVRFLVDNPSKRVSMGEKGYEKIMQLAHTDVSVAKLESIYQTLYANQFIDMVPYTC